MAENAYLHTGGDLNRRSGGEGTSLRCTLYFSYFRTSFSFSLWLGWMRPFYQAHWDISNDIKHVWLLFCTYYIAWIFQWILGDEGMMRPSVQGVDHPVCCVLDAAVTYARDSSCWFQEGLLSSRGGGGGGADILAPGLPLHLQFCVKVSWGQ